MHCRLVITEFHARTMPDQFRQVVDYSGSLKTRMSIRVQKPFFTPTSQRRFFKPDDSTHRQDATLA